MHDRFRQSARSGGCHRKGGCQPVREAEGWLRPASALPRPREMWGVRWCSERLPATSSCQPTRESCFKRGSRGSVGGRKRKQEGSARTPCESRSGLSCSWHIPPWPPSGLSRCTGAAGRAGAGPPTCICVLCSSVLQAWRWPARQAGMLQLRRPPQIPPWGLPRRRLST